MIIFEKSVIDHLLVNAFKEIIRKSTGHTFREISASSTLTPLLQRPFQGTLKGKRDGVIGLISKRKNRNWMKKIASCIERDWVNLA